MTCAIECGEGPIEDMGHHCCSKQKVKRGLWSPEEDEKLIRHITTHGHGCWSSVPKLAGLQRCGKSCRLRWINYLRPDLKRGSFTEQEERIIIDVHRILGNRWAQIAKHLPGRTDNEVKNFWNSVIKKKLIAQGLDPNTHNLLSTQQGKNRSNTSSKVHPHQQPSSVFTVDTSPCKEMEVKAPLEALTLPNSTTSFITPTSLNEPSNITTFEFQNPNNLTWTTDQGTKSQHPIMEFSSCSSMESTPISTSSMTPSGFGILTENCMWANGFEPSFERAAQEEMQQEQQGFEQQGKVSDQDQIYRVNDQLNFCHSAVNAFDNSNIDFEFMDSALVPPGIYCNVNSMDHLAWDC